MLTISFLASFFIFSFGLFIGSFLNVVIFRLHSSESIVFGRSHCMQCKKELSWYELIPIVSFLAQRGKCRHCGSQLSWQYPLVELATAALFLLGFIFLPTLSYLPLHILNSVFQISYSLFFVWAIYSLCIIIFVYDLRYLLIPDVSILWGSALMFAAGILGIWRVPTIMQIFGSTPVPWWGYTFLLIITASLCALPFFLIVFLSSGKWMGLGDVKLAFFMGMILGLHAFFAIFLGVIIGAIIGIALMAIGKAGMKTLVPFGPFLVLGTLVTLFWGQRILDYASGFLWLPF